MPILPSLDSSATAKAHFLIGTISIVNCLSEYYLVSNQSKM